MTPSDVNLQRLSRTLRQIGGMADTQDLKSFARKSVRVRLSYLALLLFFSISCEPPCLKGHLEKRWSPEYYTLEPMTIGEMTIYINEYHPGYWYDHFVCDQYEIEKMPK